MHNIRDATVGRGKDNPPEVGATFAALVFKACWQRQNKRSEMSVFQRGPQLGVWVLVERVQIVTQRAREQHRILMQTSHGTVTTAYTTEIWASAHETRDSISLISYTGCLGLSPVYFSENSL